MVCTSGTRKAFTLIELLVVIAIIAILAVVVVLTLNPAQLLAQSRDANRVSDMATLASALNLYTTDQSSALQLGTTTNTYLSIPDPNGSSTCGSLGMPALVSSTWTCSSSANYRLATSTGWLGVNFNLISSGSPFGSLPVDPVNQTSSGLFYAYNTNGSQFEVTGNFESSKYKQNYGNNVQTNYFPNVISAGTPGISALYNPSGLAGYWPLNDGVGSTTIDQSGNGVNLTWNGSSTNGSYYTAGKIGSYAGNFNGANNYIANVSPSGPITSIAGPFTMAAWVNVPSTGNNEIIVCTMTGFSGAGMEFYLNPSNIPVVAIFTGTSTNQYAGSAISANAWHHVAVTYNGSLVSLYADGAVISSSTNSINPAAPGGSGQVRIWLPYNQGGVVNFLGSIDDVRVYSRALSAAEIKALYTAGK